jgi:hypothetical protein
MNETEWLNSLPNNPSNDRDNKILQAINNGLAVCTWHPIVSSIPGHTAIFQVCEDAVHVILEDESRFRFQVSASLAQKAADLLEAILPTAKIHDLSYQQAKIKLPATLLPPGPDMVTTKKSIVWNQALEKKRKSLKVEGLVRDCGKVWILSNRLGLRNNIAVNYGFYDPRAPYTSKSGQQMWQTIGTRHNAYHTDYSQTLVLMSSTCQVDGQQMSTYEVMQSPTLNGLISDEGILKFIRQPNH